VTPIASGLAHWFHCEQRNHWFGYWFGHDMFTPPFVGPDGKLTYDPKLRDAAAKGPEGKMVYPEIARDAVLFGGTDPGRFCPTYMIFCESFIPHDCQPEQDTNFDRRDVYLITQNALADNVYLDYIRAQYNRSAQIDPPFFQNFLPGTFPTVFHGQTRIFSFLDYIFENIGAHIEFRRRTGTSWFKPDHFTNVKDLASKLRGKQDPLSKFLYDKLSPETQKLVDSQGGEKDLEKALSKDFNTILAGGTIYDPERFRNIKLPILIVEATGQPSIPAGVIRLNRRMLEEAYPGDIEKSLGGVYPDTEITTPTREDNQQCINDYYEDASRRLQHDMQFPNEPHQIRPGEDVHAVNGHIQINGGQSTVMNINGLLTKIIFDKNPEHEFYVEESFPLDWMYPYLSPYSVIMKINRTPVRITQDLVDRDHAFWSHFSDRTIGNWITYDTSIKDLCDWADRTYLRHDFAGFTGDRKFVRDDDAQKAFSKMRSAVGASIYDWHAHNSADPAERALAAKEAEFAFKQSFAYCPFSPEPVFHLMNLLLASNRIDDALRVLQTCHNLDPYNDQINNLIEQLQRNKGNQADQVKQMFANIQRAVQANQPGQARQMLDQLLHFPTVDPQTMMGVAATYLRLGDLEKSEEGFERLVQMVPNESGPWYNLAIVEANRNEDAKAIESVKKAVALNGGEMKKNPKGVNLRDHLNEDTAMARLRQTAAFKAAFPATNPVSH
jgi:tetratricopeptide (TPR) repeat protein